MEEFKNDIHRTQKKVNDKMMRIGEYKSEDLITNEIFSGTFAYNIFFQYYFYSTSNARMLLRFMQGKSCFFRHG